MKLTLNDPSVSTLNQVVLVAEHNKTTQDYTCMHMAVLYMYSHIEPNTV